MTSLAEVYADARNESLRRLYLGTGLFVAGTLTVVVAIVVATTDTLAALGIGTFAAREIAGVLAGLGVPAVFVGIFTVLPARPYERAAAAIGASIAVFGVVLFVHAYPTRWYGAAPDHLTLPVVAVYFLGTIVTFWALFTAVVNFKTRNDPGGTVTLERTIGGETKRVEVPVSELDGGAPESSAPGGVGVLGNVDRTAVMESGDDATVTTSDASATRGGSTASGGTPGSAAASDGGTSANDLRTPGGEPKPDPASDPDVYCGNCAQFDYVRSDGAIRPYCEFHDELMDDMEACSEWEPNRPGR